MINQEALEALEERMGVEFSNRNLLIQAITHRSYLNEHPKHPTGHYERLEFLGDAVLELLVTDHLYRHFSEQGEGDLTEKRSALVEAANLAEIGSELNLATVLLMSKGERKNIRESEKTRRYLTACCVEALIGAMYLDQGLGACRLFVDAFVLKRMKRVFETRRDYKTELQDYAQAEHDATPHYEVIEEFGPDHDRRFRVACIMEGERIGVGTGSSKKEAQVAAAQAALEILKERKPNSEAVEKDREGSQAPIPVREPVQRPETVVVMRKRHPPTGEGERSFVPTPAAFAAHSPAEAEKEKEMKRTEDQEFVEYVVRMMVNHPEDVRTERRTDEKGVLIVLHVHPNDMSYVLGRGGKNVDALRTLLKAVGGRRDSAVSLKIHESDEDFERHRSTSGSTSHARVEGE